jgi:hypothetical protein
MNANTWIHLVPNVKTGLLHMDHVVCFSAYKDVNCGEVIIHYVSCFFISTHKNVPGHNSSS